MGLNVANSSWVEQLHGRTYQRDQDRLQLPETMAAYAGDVNGEGV